MFKKKLISLRSAADFRLALMGEELEALNCHPFSGDKATNGASVTSAPQVIAGIARKTSRAILLAKLA